MFQVWKFPIDADDYFHVDMPSGSKILAIQTQNGQPQMWALVNPELGLIRRFFRLAGTGHGIDPKEAENYVGTFQLYDGSFVGHLFELIEDQ